MSTVLETCVFTKCFDITSVVFCREIACQNTYAAGMLLESPILVSAQLTSNLRTSQLEQVKFF